MPPDQRDSRELARRLVLREATSGRAEALAEAAAFERAIHDLARWIGQTGAHALFARAVSLSRVEHPAIDAVSLRPGPDATLEGVEAGVNTHGSAAIAGALAAALVTLIELLGRLVGDDMASRLVEHSETGQGNPT